MTLSSISDEALAEIAACPFCGNATRVKVSPWPEAEGDPPGFYVICSAAGWTGQKGLGCGCGSAWGETPAEAIAAWNRRVPDPELAALRQQVKDMGEALKPFAAVGEAIVRGQSLEEVRTWLYPVDFFAARSTLNPNRG